MLTDVRGARFQPWRALSAGQRRESTLLRAPQVWTEAPNNMSCTLVCCSNAGAAASQAVRLHCQATLLRMPQVHIAAHCTIFFHMLTYIDVCRAQKQNGPRVHAA